MKIYAVTVECALVPYAVDTRILGVFDSFDAAKKCEEKAKKFFRDNKIESYFYEESASSFWDNDDEGYEENGTFWRGGGSDIEELYEDLVHMHEITLNQDYPITGIGGLGLDGGLQIGPAYYE